MTNRITWPIGMAVTAAALVLGGCNKSAPADTTVTTTPAPTMSAASSSMAATASAPMDSASARMNPSSDAMAASSAMGMASGASAP